MQHETAATHGRSQAAQMHIADLALGMALLRGLQDRIWPLTCGAKGTRTPGLLDANQTLFQLSYSPGCLPTRVPGAYWLGRIPGRDWPQAQSRRLLEQAGQAAVGQRLAAGLAGRAVLQRGVGERDLLDRVAAHRAVLAGSPRHRPAALFLAP